MSDDPRLAAARYRAAKDGEETDASAEASAERTRAANAVDRAAYVETAIQQAIRRGEFDDLPGAGKPIPGLGDHHDPDWWIRRKIEAEQLTGLGPPALRLRVEDAELDMRLDEFTRESDVRIELEDFNRRVVDARRQLLGGPPVVTPTRDVDAEITAWRDRRDARDGQARAAEDEARDASARPGRGIPSLVLGRASLAVARIATVAPRGDLGVDVSRRRDHRRSAEQLPPGVDDPTIEVLELDAHVGLACELIETHVELGVLDAQPESRRSESGQLLRLDLAPDPPVGVVVVAETRDGLAGSGKIVELTTPDRLLDRGLDVRGAVHRVRGARAFSGCLGRGIRLFAVLRGPVASRREPRVVAHEPSTWSRHEWRGA